MNSIIRPKSDFTFNGQIPDGKTVESKDSGEFNVNIMERGTKYVEKIKVDEDNDIEYFHVTVLRLQKHKCTAICFPTITIKGISIFFNFHVSVAFNSKKKTKTKQQQQQQQLQAMQTKDTDNIDTVIRTRKSCASSKCFFCGFALFFSGHPQIFFMSSQKRKDKRLAL